MDQPKDTTIYIWEYLFEVRIPLLAAISKHELETRGMVVSGIPEYDKDYSKSLVTRYMNIVDMVKLFSQGVSIRIVNYNDIPTIYKYIEDHLIAWKQQLDRGINIGNAPFKDLLDMDQFANAIYDKGKYTFHETLNSSKQQAQFNSILKPIFDTSKINKFLGVNEMSHEEQIASIPERDSLADVFQSRVFSING